MKVPFVDLQWQHAIVADEVDSGWAKVIGETSFIEGAAVKAFEREFAAHEGAAACVGVANGTEALELALRACGIGTGDEVAVPANSFVASAEAVARAGARPVFIDVDPDYLLLDPACLADRLDERVRAIMPVHLFGQMGPMEPLSALAREARIPVIEDAAQAQGARQNGRAPGEFGEVAATSFYPSKNLGAYGDAGAVVTASDELARRVRALRNHGSLVKNEHAEIGVNSRLDSLQAVVLSAKLRHLAEWNAERRRAASTYGDLLADIPGLRLPRVAPGNEHVWHLYVVRVPDRDRILELLHEAGIGAGVHYPIPIHLQQAFAHHGHRPGDFPVAEEAASSMISLPLYPGIRREQQEHVADVLRRALG